MRKNIQQILRGFLFYRVNSGYYFLYSKAQRIKENLRDDGIDIIFDGYHIMKSWVRLYSMLAIDNRPYRQYEK